jgi:hypothetical protein
MAAIFFKNCNFGRSQQAASHPEQGRWQAGRWNVFAPVAEGSK